MDEPGHEALLFAGEGLERLDHAGGQAVQREGFADDGVGVLRQAGAGAVVLEPRVLRVQLGAVLGDGVLLLELLAVCGDGLGRGAVFRGSGFDGRVGGTVGAARVVGGQDRVGGAHVLRGSGFLGLGQRGEVAGREVGHAFLEPAERPELFLRRLEPGLVVREGFEVGEIFEIGRLCHAADKVAHHGQVFGRLERLPSGPDAAVVVLLSEVDAADGSGGMGLGVVAGVVGQNERLLQGGQVVGRDGALLGGGARPGLFGDVHVVGSGLLQGEVEFVHGAIPCRRRWRIPVP